MIHLISPILLALAFLFLYLDQFNAAIVVTIVIALWAAAIIYYNMFQVLTTICRFITSNIKDDK